MDASIDLNHDLNRDLIRRCPKVLLHDHLDGGMRPSSVIEMAEAIGHKLPTTDVGILSDWFHEGAKRNNLELYLETFAHTSGVLQTREALIRAARECAEDLAADGVVYAEVRFAPELHQEMGLDLDEIVEAVLEGFDAGPDTIQVRVLCTAMRTMARSFDIAELALRHRDQGVVGFDIAGAEAGFPPSRHLDAFQLCLRENFHITIHAGEAFGLPSIAEALSYCGAERLGHGVRIVDDIETLSESPKLGRLAHFVRDRRVPLEMCPTSNIHTGAASSYQEHPIALLAGLGFRVTVNTDNRLMSQTTMTDEFAHLVEHLGVDLKMIEWMTVNAAKSSFIHFDDRLALITDIKQQFAAIRAEAT